MGGYVPKRATKVACISWTASSIDTPEPSFRISTPKIFIVVAAPCSLVPQRVMSKGRIWSEYQGLACSLKPETRVFWIPESSSMVAPAGRPMSRTSWLLKIAFCEMKAF